MKTTSPTYLFKSRHGVFYCRVRIPLCIKKQYNTSKNEVKISLNTRNHSVALKAARRLWVELENSHYTMKDIHDEMELAEQEENEGRKLLKQFLVATIQSKETGILENEDVDTFFVDSISSESETKILFRKLNSHQKTLLLKQLDSWGDVPLDKQKKILLNLKMEIENPFDQPRFFSSPLPTEYFTATESIDLPSQLLINAIDEYMQHYIDIRSRGKNPKPISPETINEYRGIFREFVRIIDGSSMKIVDLTKELIGFYDQLIWKVPVSFIKSPKYRDMSVADVIALGEKTKSNSTISKHVLVIKDFLKWAGDKNKTPTGLRDSFNKIYSDDTPDNLRRDAFSPEELHKLFNNEIYENGLFDNPSRYWLPLIALFTGMRGREIAQLYADDIQEDHDSKIWFFNVRANPKRKQWKKNTNAQRKIPIHPQLKKLGFIDYLKSKNPEMMLFPELYNESGNHYKNFGNSFNRQAPSGWKWKCGVKGNTTFHSFRHNVVDFLEKANAHKRPACFLIGHKYVGGFVSNYVKSDVLKELYNVIKIISFPSIDWTKIETRRW